VRLFTNRSQMTKYGKNKKVAHEATAKWMLLPHFDVFSDLLLII